MALTLSLSQIRFNLITSKFDLVNASSGSPVITKAVIRVKAPDLTYYYTAGNNSSTFAAPNTSSTPDFTSNAGTNSLLSLPLDINGVPQHGVYIVEMSAYDGASNYTMVAVTFGYCFDKPSLAITYSLDCVYAKLTASDTTVYTKDGVSPNGTISFSLSKDVLIGNNADGTPIVLPSNYNLSTTYSSVAPINLVRSLNLYAGGYTGEISATLIYSFPSFSVTTTVSFKSKTTVACIDTLCDVFCGINTLRMNMEDVKGVNPYEYEEIKDRFNLIISYVELYKQAVTCKATTTQTDAIAQIKKIGNFSESCCNKGDNYLIMPFDNVCKCASSIWVEVPSLSTSLQSPLGITYVIGDKAYDSNYIYIYAGAATWGRTSIFTW